MARYEEMKEDQEKMLRKIAEFIGYTITEGQIKVNRKEFREQVSKLEKKSLSRN